MALRSISQKLPKIKIRKHFYLKNLLFPLTSASEILSWMHCFITVNIFTLKNCSGLRQSAHSGILSNQSNFENWKIHRLKMVHLRQILLAEVRGNKRFFKVKVLSKFNFGDFGRNWLQRHLETQLLWTKFCLWDYQFMSIVWKMSSKSNEQSFFSFFPLKWGVLWYLS